jgi:putative oxidoreductase
MNQEVTERQSSRMARVLFWTLKILVALAFAAAALAKLAGAPNMVQEFGRIGLGQSFRFFTGVVELSGATLLLVPRTAFYGTVLLTGICFGAFLAQIGPLKGDLIHVFVLGSAVLLLGWLSRPSWMLRKA